MTERSMRFVCPSHTPNLAGGAGGFAYALHNVRQPAKRLVFGAGSRPYLWRGQTTPGSWEKVEAE